MTEAPDFATGLNRVFDDLEMAGDLVPAERRRRAGRRRRSGGDENEPGESIEMRLVERMVDGEGVLVLDDGTLPPLPADARRGRRGGEEKAVWERSLAALPRNQIGDWLRKLDHKLTPHTGLRAYDPRKEGWWERTPDESEATSPPDLEGVSRALLLVHGTFSHTDSLLGQIAGEVSGAGGRFLEWAAREYDRVLTFDHPTLSASPMINAHALSLALGDFGGDIDVVCHSRGGLVTRWWLEAFDRGGGARRAMFVASPLAGTGLAAPPNLRSSLSLLSNVSRVLGTAAAGAPFLIFVSGLFKVVASVSSLASRTPALDAAVALVPGLAAQQRVGNTPEIHNLRIAPPDPDGRYFAVRANFEPETPGWRFWKYFRVDRARYLGAGAIFDGHNDLVVDSGSMVQLSDAMDIPSGQVLDFGTTEHVHHTSYFQQSDTLDFIRECFGSVPDRPAALEAPPEAPLEAPSAFDVAADEADEAPDSQATASSAAFSDARPSHRLRRTPHMDVSPDAAAAPGQELAVTVWADQRAARPGEASTDVAVDLPEGVDQVKLDVRLATTAHFTVVGPSVQPVTLDRNEARSVTEATFTVVVRDRDGLADAVNEGADPREGGLMALFDHDGRPAGSVTRRVRLASNTTNTVTSGRSGDGSEADRSRCAASDSDDDEATSDLDIDPRAEGADLQVRVYRVQGDPPDRFVCDVWSPHVDLGLEPEPWHAGRGRDVVDAALDRFINAPPRQRTSELRGAGYGFFEAAPSIFQRYFWHLHDQVPEFETISVVTMESVLPWELMVPTRDDEGPDDPLLPLGVMFDVGRWTSDTVQAAPQRIRLGGGLVVAPVYSDPKHQLAWSSDEAEAIARDFGVTPLEPATSEALEDAFHDTAPGLFHFVGHGYADAAFQELALDEGERVGETVLRDWLKVSRYLKRGPTLVVLNACEVGRPQPQFIGSGGIPAAFIKERAAAVLAPFWSVKDSVAREVAERFYTTIREQPGIPLARILRDIRRSSYERGDDIEDSYAAYCFYGDPRATAELQLREAETGSSLNQSENEP